MRRSKTTYAVLTLALLILVVPLPSKSADSQDIRLVAQVSASSLSAPKRPLSDFAQFELEPMTVWDEIRKNTGKMEKARELERKLKAKVWPLLGEWNAASNEGGSDKLLIRPHLQKLKIISGGLKLLAGAFTGHSFIDMELVLVDASTDEEVSRVLIKRNSSQNAKITFSNKNDKRVIDYVVSIAYEYLAGNNDLTKSKSFTAQAEESGNSKTLLSGNSVSGESKKNNDSLTNDASTNENVASISESNLSEQPVSSTEMVQIDGTYISKITSNHQKTFKKKYQNLKITIKQTGNNVIATNNTYKLKFSGIREGNVIKFSIAQNHVVSRFYGTVGEWTVSPDGISLEGFWKLEGGHGAAGKWNLTRIE